MSGKPARVAIGAVVAVLAFFVLQRYRGMDALFANIVALAIGALTYSILESLFRMRTVVGRHRNREWPPGRYEAATDEATEDAVPATERPAYRDDAYGDDAYGDDPSQPPPD